MNYKDFFKEVTDFPPYPWQECFSKWSGKSIAVVSAPTGAGKESGAIIPWLYDYKKGVPSTTRLAYTLPTRSLVDQVYRNTQRVVQASGLPIQVYCLKGGQIEHGFEQDLTQPAILIGTQDQLLSRALNRGFGVSWGQRPLHCAALTNDCRWVLDEIQLTGVAYSTLVQLYKHWQALGTFGNIQLCLMSATFDDRPLSGLDVERFELTENDLANPVLAAKVTRTKPVFSHKVESVKDIATLVKTHHTPGSLSLVVLNTVARVRELGNLLAELNPLVIHSRFLGFDREQLQQQILGFKGVIIATQVVEAGVDLDADLLVTELCPWSSFVQRCGRCGRKRTDNSVKIYWLDYTVNWKPAPYTDADCKKTQDILIKLTDASLQALCQIPLPELKLPSYPLTHRDVEIFFCTHYKSRDTRYTISEYVRDPDTFTVSVVWSNEPPHRLPHQKFTCPVPTEELKTFCQSWGITTRVWGDETWDVKTPNHGDVVWLPLSVGGYSHQRGWTADPNDKPQAYSLELEPEYNDPPFPHNLPLGIHLKDTEAFLVESISHLQWLGFSDSLIEDLCLCARWHDWGKAHPIWQSYANTHGTLLAKSVSYAHPQKLKGYRHELASAFAAASQAVSFLSQYLIAAHHGKVRDNLWTENPKEEFNSKIVRGVELGTYLPSFEIDGVETLPKVQLTFGKAVDWEKQVRGLLRQHGPFKLIYLEAVIRNADVKASHYRQQEARNDSNRNC